MEASWNGKKRMEGRVCGSHELIESKDGSKELGTGKISHGMEMVWRIGTRTRGGGEGGKGGKRRRDGLREAGKDAAMVVQVVVAVVASFPV